MLRGCRSPRLLERPTTWAGICPGAIHCTNRRAHARNPVSVEDVLLLAKRHPGARGLRRLRVALPYVDGGAASPKETWLRLLLIDAGLPVPTTQIPVIDGYRPVAFLDMGWRSSRWPLNTTVTNTQ